MATYTTKKCPHCGKAYAIGESRSVVHYGSPIRVCLFCNKQFIDKDYKELAFQEVDAVYTKKIQPLGIVAIIIGLCFLVFELLMIGLSYILENGAAILLLPFGFIAFGIFFIISDIHSYRDRLKHVEQARSESIKRLQNPEYAKLLHQYGYPVPEKYMYPEKYSK